MKNASNWLKNTLSKLISLVESERKIGIEILELLFEIEQRKAYVELGYDGIYTFCVKELKFSESQAFQRIQAMRALHSVPALKEKIVKGSMSISTVAQVQGFIRQEQTHGIQRTPEEKQNLFAQFENQSSKEVKIAIQEMKGVRIKTTLLLELDEETESLWKEFKSSSVHQTLGDDLNGFRLLLKSWLGIKNSQVPKRHVSAKSRKAKEVEAKEVEAKEVEAKEVLAREVAAKGVEGVAKEPADKFKQFRRAVSGSTQVAPVQVQKFRSRYVQVAVRREVFKRDQYKCTQCGSTHALTLEPITPYAKGGTHDADNLKVLCRSCNLYQGVQHFGTTAMNRGFTLI